MQQGIHADLALEVIPGKGIALMAVLPVEKDDLVVQYVGEVLSQAMYLEREMMVSVLSVMRATNAVHYIAFRKLICRHTRMV